MGYLMVLLGVCKVDALSISDEKKISCQSFQIDMWIGSSAIFIGEKEDCSFNISLHSNNLKIQRSYVKVGMSDRVSPPVLEYIWFIHIAD